MKGSRLAVRWLGVASATLAVASTVAVLAAPASTHAAAYPSALAPAPAAASTGDYTNPIAEQRADPHIVKHTDGYYYFTATVPKYDRIILRRAKTIQGLSTAEEKTIWTKHAKGEMSAHIWAPEIHHIDGKWYIYFAAGKAEDVWAIRPYLLENADANPLEGEWVEKGRIKTHLETFSLDATTFVHKGTRYMAWAQADPQIGPGTSIFLAPMTNPWTIKGRPERISVPTHGWETEGHRVNEGPAVIQRNGKIFMTYSASATDHNYCLGLLTASADDDLMKPSSWVKTTTPIFTSNAATGQWGPGHNSFTVSEDGRSDILVYHDRNYRDIKGEPLDNPDRRTRVQTVYWNADGTPNLGIPVADGVTPVRLRAHNAPDSFVRHWEYRVKLEPMANPNGNQLADSQYRIVPGLSSADGVSLESANFPGYYLRARANGEVWVDKSDGSDAFKASATFHRRAGLADAGKLSLEAVSNAGRFVRHRGGLLYVEEVADDAAKKDATFDLSPRTSDQQPGPNPEPSPSPDKPSPPPATSPSPDPSTKPTPSASTGATPSATPGGGKPGGGLPVTGTDVTLMAGGGAALLGLGLGLYLLARRRRNEDQTSEL